MLIESGAEDDDAFVCSSGSFVTCFMHKGSWQRATPLGGGPAASWSASTGKQKKKKKKNTGKQICEPSPVEREVAENHPASSNSRTSIHTIFSISPPPTPLTFIRKDV
jgi:hypothetical protein